MAVERDPVKIPGVLYSDTRGRMVCVRIVMLLFVVLFACLASPALSRRQPPESESVVAVTTTPVDESKLNMVFCLAAACKYAGHWHDCYCCGNVYQTDSCRRTLEECKAHCPQCNPRCSPSPPTAVRSTQDAT